MSSPYCIDSGPVCVGYVSVFYLGGACHLEILDHGYYPRWVVDCGDPVEVDEYCVYMNGSIGGATALPGDCDPTPVRDETWGAVKAMYR